MELTPFASYGQYSRLVREPLVWLGRDDPIKSLDQVREADPRLAQWRALAAGCIVAFTLNQAIAAPVIVRNINDGPPMPARSTDWHTERQKWEQFKPAVLAVAGERGRADADKLGYWLRANKDRVVDGMRFVTDGKTGGVTRWKLIKATP